jgi:hypothetical protein
VISSRIIARAKIEIALDATPFNAESPVKQLSPADVVLLAYQEVELSWVLLIGNCEYCLWIDVVKPSSHRFLK